MAPIPRIDTSSKIVQRGVSAPLAGIKKWRPFSIDALGLVTLLGAEEVNQALGTLARRRYLEFLPLLAANIVAGDTFRNEQAGHALYNITDGITTTELKGWLTRWLSVQTIHNATSIFTFEVKEKHERGKLGLGRLGAWIAPLLSFVVVAPLFACTVLVCRSQHLTG